MKALLRTGRVGSRAQPAIVVATTMTRMTRTTNMTNMTRMTGMTLAMLGTFAFGPASAWAGITATTANDVCASNADPCNVTSTYDVTANAVLDFGTRSVNVSGGGQFNFGANSGRITCGNFTASTTGAFLSASGPAPGGGATTSGAVLLLARRRCTSLDPLVPCLDIGDCELGPCGVRRCSKKTTRTCQADGDCQIGTCGPLRRCTGSTTFVRCSTNADCDYGTCPAQTTCTGRGDNPMNCSDNSDCSFGTCSVGTASATLNGIVAGSSDNPATIVVRAADSVSISKPVNLNSSAIDSDGGSLSVDARAGSITVTGKINAVGGGTSQGGSVELNAGMDILVYEDVSVIGGDFDGGAIDFTSGRDVRITRSLLANSNSGAGFGGDIILSAGRDLSFSGVSAANKSTIETSGHTNIENSAGDGGSQELLAARNLILDVNTRLIGNGSAPDGSGSDVVVASGASLVMDGNVTAKATGIQGAGGYLEITSDGGAVSVGPAATFDVTGSNSGGGGIDIISSTGDLTFAGTGDVSASSGGTGGAAFLTARQAASLSGDLVASGGGGGVLYVDGCRVTLDAGASLVSNATGSNTLVAHDSMQLLAGSAMTTAAGGSNTLRYRTAAKPPLRQGTISPAPALVLDPSLSECPLCGNREIDAGESCDDGNAVGGDGCNAECQNENCLAQTISPGYPTVAICEDGNVCTADVCNAALNGGTCQHPPKNCDDSIACTIDACNADDGTCRHSTSDSMCNDGNACTDDFCSLTTGCSNTANSSPCDDNNRCTESDVCANKVCRGTRINGCLFCGDEYVNGLAGETCDDGNAEGGDCCSSTCRFEAANSPCEDLQFCTLNDTCNGAGTCLSGPPNTCADTDACTADSCSEDMAVCVNAQTPRDTATCLVAPSAKLQIKNSARTGKDKLLWQWSRGEAVLPADLGTPDAGTGYTLCVYDRTAAVSSLRASIDIAPSDTLWKIEDPSVAEYKDKAGTSDGVLKAQLRSGEAGNTKVKVGAGGANLVLPSPAGASFFSQDPNVVVQLVNGAGTCWTSQFTPGNTKTNEAALFKATTK